MSRLIALAVILLIVGLVVVAFRSRGVDDEGVAVASPASDGRTVAAAASAGPSTSAGSSASATASPSGAASAASASASQSPAGTAPTGASEPGPSGGEPDPSSSLTDLGPHRALVDVDGWLQSDVASLEELRGKVVVVQFWTFGCSNCKNTLPNLRQLYAGTSRDQVEFVGVHAPEFDFEADVDNIAAAAADLEVTWPIVLDTRRRTFHDWQEGSRAYWPRTYVLDQQGHVRFDHIGEGGYDELNATVATLVANPVLGAAR